MAVAEPNSPWSKILEEEHAARCKPELTAVEKECLFHGIDAGMEASKGDPEVWRVFVELRAKLKEILE